MNAGALLLVDVGNFIKPTIADKSPMGQRKRRFFSNNCRLNLEDLRHMIRGWLEFIYSDSVVDGDKHLPIDVSAIVDASEVLNEVFAAHSTLRLHRLSMQICIEHDDRKRQNENLKGMKLVSVVLTVNGAVAQLTVSGDFNFDMTSGLHLA